MRADLSRAFALCGAAVALMIGLSIGAAAAMAQPPAVEDPSAAEARALFERGHQLAADSRFSEAAQSFQRSLDLVDRPSTMFNLGICFFALDRHVEATAILERFTEAADPAEEAESIADARRMLTHARASVAHIIIEVVPSSATVLVDGQPLAGDATRSVAVNPGPHVVRVEAPHHAPTLLELTSRPGEEQRRAVQLDSTRQQATLSVEVPDRAQAAISVDGTEIGVGAASIELDAGPHQILVLEPGTDPLTRNIELEWNQRLRLALFLPPRAAPSLAEEPAFWGVLGGGVGVVALAVLAGVLLSDMQATPNGGTTGEVITLMPMSELP